MCARPKGFVLTEGREAERSCAIGNQVLNSPLLKSWNLRTCRDGDPGAWLCHGHAVLAAMGLLALGMHPLPFLCVLNPRADCGAIISSRQGSAGGTSGGELQVRFGAFLSISLGFKGGC